ncbi:ketopantoate reductase family protein [Rhizobium leguminosarum]|uniref:ketopantoate reductase family protein n=1 Tax=Rhizobium leguminosarum TaxID=384 RepID=UPI003F9D9989
MIDNEIHHRDLRFSIAGAGAIGLTLAAKLVRANCDVSVIARGTTLSVLNQKQLLFIDQNGEHRLEVKAASAADAQVADVLFLCAKAQDLADLAVSVAHSIDKETLIVPVVNGIPWWYFQQTTGDNLNRRINAVDPKGVLADILPSSQIIGTVTTITSERLEPGVIRSLNPLSLVIGEIDDSVRNRTHRLASTLTGAGISTTVSERIRDSVWGKVIANLIANPLSVLTGAPLVDICAHPTLSVVTRQLLIEGMTVAAAYGARFDLDPDAMLALGASKGKFKTSMLQDFEHGRPLELGSICEAVLELAELKRVPMPFARNIAAMVAYRGESVVEQVAIAAE